MTARGEMSEAAFQSAVVESARIHGWMVWYQPDWVYRLIMRDMQRRRVRRDWPDSGFPDLWLLHPERNALLVIECKSAKGSVRETQKAWLAALAKAGITAIIARPKDLSDLDRILSGESSSL